MTYTPTTGAPAELAASINGNIRAEIARQGTPVTSIAHDLGWSEASLRRRLRGEIEWGLSEIERFAQIMDVPALDLLK